MSRARFKSHEDDSGDIDLTPMLDVVFIMLIFFIVTASFVKEQGIELNRPDSSDAPPNEENVTVLVSVGENGEIMMEGRRIDIRAVRANIQRKLAEAADAPVIIQAAEKAKATMLVRIADQAREAGAYDVSLVKE